jgi:hypothetical protein
MAGNPLRAWGAHLIPFEGEIDIDYLLDIPNAEVARRAYEFLKDRNNQIELFKRHGQEDMQRMWRGVLRGCIAHGVPLPDNHLKYARMLGVAISR